MRILLLLDCYLPSTKSAALLMHDLGFEMTKQGHQVSIVAPDCHLEKKMEVTKEDGMTIVRVFSEDTRGVSKPQRAWREMRLSSLIWRRANAFFKDNPNDLIVYYSPTIFFGHLVAKLKKLWQAKTYLILRDIFPQWAIDAGILAEGPIAAYFRRVEKNQYKQADIIGVQSPANLAYFKDKPWANHYRLEVLYNWMSLHRQAIPKTNYREQWGLENKTILFYGGNIGIAQDMDNIIRLAENLKDCSDVYILMVGEGSEAARIQTVIEEKNMTNIAIYPAVEQQAYLGLVQECDIGLLSLDKQLTTQNIPGKLLSYLYQFKPVLASINPGNDLENLIIQSKAGFVLHNGDDVQLAKAARELIAQPALRYAMGENARNLLESTFNVKQAANQIVQHCYNHL